MKLYTDEHQFSVAVGRYLSYTFEQIGRYNRLVFVWVELVRLQPADLIISNYSNYAPIFKLA